jgi:hypothetical protein
MSNVTAIAAPAESASPKTGKDRRKEIVNVRGAEVIPDGERKDQD